MRSIRIENDVCSEYIAGSGHATNGKETTIERNRKMEFHITDRGKQVNKTEKRVTADVQVYSTPADGSKSSQKGETNIFQMRRVSKISAT